MDADGGVGEQPLDGLVDRDRLPELDPGFGVCDRCFEQVLRRADGVGGQPEPADVERP